MKFFGFLFVLSILAQEEFTCTPILGRVAGSFCEDFNQDRPAIKCSNCLDELDCLETSDEKCSWSYGKCVYHNDGAMAVVLTVGLLFFFLMCCTSCVSCYQYCKGKEEGENDFQYWARKCRYLEGKQDIVKEGTIWLNMKYHVCNKVEILKLFFGDSAHPTSKVEALILLFFAFSYSAVVSCVMKSSESPDYATIGLVFHLLVVTIPIALVSAVYTTLNTCDERAQLQSENCCVQACATWIPNCVSMIMMIMNLLLWVAALMSVPYLMNPRCFVATTVLFGFVGPQISGIFTTSVIFVYKWRKEKRKIEENRASVVKITVSNKVADRLLLMTSIENIIKAGIHLPAKYMEEIEESNEKPMLPIIMQDADVNLPDGWEMSTDPNGKVFYIDPINKRSSWHRPTAHMQQDVKVEINTAPAENNTDILPEGWEKSTAPNGQTYYIDHVNKTSSWERPKRN